MVKQIADFGEDTVVIIDMKGDVASCNAAREIAKRAGKEFYLFSTAPMRASRLFNILNDDVSTALGVGGLAEIVCQSAGVSGGTGSPLGFFDAINERTLKRTLELFKKEGMAADVRGDASGSLLEAGKNAARHRPTAGWNSLRTSPRRANVSRRTKDRTTTGTEPIDSRLFENAITVEKMVSRPGIFYLDFAALLSPSTAAMLSVTIVRIILAHLVSRPKTLPRVRRVVFVFDEAQEGILEPSMRTPLKQGRQFGASFVFAHQNLSDLKRNNVDLTDVVRGNTSVTMILSARDTAGREHLTNFAGERIRPKMSRGRAHAETPTGETIGETETITDETVPVFGQNELNEFNADTSAVVEASPCMGYTQFRQGPVIVDMPFPFTKEEFDAFEKAGWPEPDGITTVLASDVPPGPLPVSLIAALGETADQLPMPATKTPTTAPQPEVTVVPTETPTAPETKRKRPPKPLDPDVDEQSKSIAETLKRVGKKPVDPSEQKPTAAKTRRPDKG